MRSDVGLEDLRRTRDYCPLRPYPKVVKDDRPRYHYIIKKAPLCGTIVHSRFDTMEAAFKQMSIYDRVEYPDTSWWVVSTPDQQVVDSPYVDPSL